MVRAVIFDMFETLVTHYQCSLYFGTQMAEDSGLPAEEFLTRWHRTEMDRTVGRLTLEDSLRQILGCQKDAEEIIRRIAEKREATKRACFERLHPGILPMLSGLKDRGVKIGLVSNCFSEEAKEIRESVLFPFFDASCLSWEEGVAKPDREIFLRCLKKLSAAAGACIYVGDGGSRELETAEGLGMKVYQAIWYFQPGIAQLSGRKPEFPPLFDPMELLHLLDRDAPDQM